MGGKFHRFHSVQGKRPKINETALMFLSSKRRQNWKSTERSHETVNSRAGEGTWPNPEVGAESGGDRYKAEREYGRRRREEVKAYSLSVSRRKRKNISK